EEGRIIRSFFKRTGQPLMQDWLIEMVKQMVRKLPVKMLFAMGLANFVRPRTSNWSGARDAIKEYAAEKHAEQRQALGLDDLVEMAKQEVKPRLPEAAE
ncbi:MAG: hypothetical protein ACR2OM_13675, partial [Aestuariivirgaceae bacterium]